MIVVVGGNDASSKIQPEAFKMTYEFVMKTVKSINPNIDIAVSEICPRRNVNTDGTIQLLRNINKVVNIFIRTNSSQSNNENNEKHECKGCNAVCLNVRHILSKFDELKNIITINNRYLDLFGLVETFLKPDINNEQCKVPGYKIFRKDRQSKDGGGLLVYVKDSIAVKNMSDLSINTLETLWLEVELPKSKPLFICTVYRPPNSPQSWIDLFEAEFDTALSENKDIILMGDFNIDLIKIDNKKWMNFINHFNLQQLICPAKRICDNSETLIDHIYTTNPENIAHCHVPSYALSDHYPICLDRKINIIFNAKKEYYQNAVSSSKNSKELWNHIKELNPKMDNIFPCKMQYENQTVYNPQDIVNILNVSSVAEKLNIGNNTSDMDFSMLQNLQIKN
ncbi:unnamed protein product [Mytilus coruscus]|uniref:Endonuclease/exonuclease/phosphatase domain-containing protein n=1 Tax=Mytilus coruscus TaxID=42192 RepID=A0A6J8D239_MYTCO|nr:unnamed protein product [Mytilus coruscus]